MDVGATVQDAALEFTPIRGATFGRWKLATDEVKEKTRVMGRSRTRKSRRKKLTESREDGDVVGENGMLLSERGSGRWRGGQPEPEREWKGDQGQSRAAQGRSSRATGKDRAGAIQ